VLTATMIGHVDGTILVKACYLSSWTDAPTSLLPARVPASCRDGPEYLQGSRPVVRKPCLVGRGIWLSRPWSRVFFSQAIITYDQCADSQYLSGARGLTSRRE
jgi:hypothetical protein